jgi:hypothetical protein
MFALEYVVLSFERCADIPTVHQLIPLPETGIDLEIDSMSQIAVNNIDVVTSYSK